MKDLLERGILIVLIGLPMYLGRKPTTSVVRSLLVAVPVAWLLLVFVAPMLG